MAQKPIRIPVNVATGKARPGQDIAAIKKQRQQFAGVGKTLPNYQYDPRDKHKLPGPTVVKKSRFGKITPKRTAIAFFVCLMLVGGFLTAKFLWNAQKIFGASVLSVLDNTKLKGEDKGRVNILLAGNSADDVGHDGGELTDSIMLMSVDTKNNKAFLMSIPRDLYVDIDDNGHSKINSAYVYGKQDKFKENGYPEGGMGLLEKTVEDNLGIDINYYALVNYKALRQAVDAVGGIDFTVKSEDPRGLYDPNIDWTTKKPLVKLSNGKHHLSGQQALNLSRARGDSYRSYGFAASDFDRTENQRQIMIALKNKATTPGVIANPAKVASLADAVGSNVKTDFKPNELKRLYDLTKKIPSNQITSVGLNDADGKNLLEGYNASGQSALIPAAGLDDFSDIQAFMKRKMSSNPIVQEGAKVVVLNGTTSDGLASKKKAALTSKGINVVKVGSAQSDTETKTVVIDNSAGKKPTTKRFLGQQYANNFTATNPYKYIYDADFIVVIGSDQIPKPKTTSTTN